MHPTWLDIYFKVKLGYTIDMLDKKTWKQAVLEALYRFTNRHSTRTIEFKDFCKEEQQQILVDTQSQTESPQRIIRLTLQHLNDENLVQYTKGICILITQSLGEEPKQISEDTLPYVNLLQQSNFISESKIETNPVDFEAFRREWLQELREGNPSTSELGRRFAHKLITQWLEIDDDSPEIVDCDGTGDGGIDMAYLERSNSHDEGFEQGDTWYIVQSKYGTAFKGKPTLLTEAFKIIDTLTGKNSNLSSLTQDLLERLKHFLAQSTSNDRLVLVFATENSLTQSEKGSLKEICKYGQKQLGYNNTIFDVESVSIETIYHRQQEKPLLLSIPIRAKLSYSEESLMIGSITLREFYQFLKNYREKTGDLERLYEKNIRRYLGIQRKINKKIKETLEKEPQNFGLYNNGITLVVNNFQTSEDYIELTEPYIVNGCQTTGTIWKTLFNKLESGGTGFNPELENWKNEVAKGVIVLKIVRVNGEEQANKITQYTNSQNRVDEKDLATLSSDFQKWQNQMKQYGIYLEVQRGGWDAQKALQKRHPHGEQLKLHAKIFDLIKVFGAGWLGVPGKALGKNSPFLPTGEIFKKITNIHFSMADLYAAYLLQKTAEEKPYGPFGRRAVKEKKDSRGSTRFLFYYIVIELLKEVLINAAKKPTETDITQSFLKLVKTNQQTILLGIAIQVLDEYFQKNTESCIFNEPDFHNNLGVYLKSDKLANKDFSPKLHQLLLDYKRLMKRGENSEIQVLSKAIF